MKQVEKVQELRDRREAALDEMRAIIEKTEREKRDLTTSETRQFEQLERTIDRIDAEIRSLDGEIEDIRRAAERDIRARRGGQIDEDAIALKPEQRMSDFVARQGMVSDEDRGLDFGKWFRGYVTGQWDSSSEGERRALAEGTVAAGGAMVPVPLASSIIDLARNKAVALRAGALTVPMEAEKLKIARVSGDPGGSWRAENTSVAESDPTFEEVEFKAKTFAVQFKASRELVQDAHDLDRTVRHAIAEALALKLDLVALRGSGTGDEPKGVRNFTGINTVSLGANGAAPTSYDSWVDAVQKVREANREPNATIYSARTGASLGKLKDTTNQPLRAPDDYTALTRLVTEQIPNNLTQGTSTDTSEAYVGFFPDLLIGIRASLQIQVLTERYADNLQIAFLAWMRADIQLAHEKSFTVITGIRP